MTSLHDAADDLRRWLPIAAELIPEPDTDGTTGGGKPGSAPPWNTAAAGAYFDAHAMVRDTEQLLRFIVTGVSADPRPWSDAATGSALDAIERLAVAVPDTYVRRAARSLTAAVTAILQLAAVDEAERPQRVAAACPYCKFPMLRVFPRSGRVACLRGMASCADADGNPPQGTIGHSQLDGTPRITWQDGLVT